MQKQAMVSLLLLVTIVQSIPLQAYGYGRGMGLSPMGGYGGLGVNPALGGLGGVPLGAVGGLGAGGLGAGGLGGVGGMGMGGMGYPRYGLNGRAAMLG